MGMDAPDSRSGANGIRRTVAPRLRGWFLPDGRTWHVGTGFRTADEPLRSFACRMRPLLLRTVDVHLPTAARVVGGATTACYNAQRGGAMGKFSELDAAHDVSGFRDVSAGRHSRESGSRSHGSQFGNAHSTARSSSR